MAVFSSQNHPRSTQEFPTSSQGQPPKMKLGWACDETHEVMTEAVVGALNCDFPRHMHGTHAAEAESTRLGAQAFEISHRH